MLSRSSFTSLAVGVFAVYVAHTCWVMYGIVYTRPCPSGGAAACVWPYLARRPKLQVSSGAGLGPNLSAAVSGESGSSRARTLGEVVELL